MLPSFLAATTLIVMCCLFVKPAPLTLKKDEAYVLGTVVITAALFYLDKDSIKEMNYSLLASLITFSEFKKHQSEKVKDYVILFNQLEFVEQTQREIVHFSLGFRSPMC